MEEPHDNYKLYFVEHDKFGGRYDVYNSFMICCRTEEEARYTHPDGIKLSDVVPRKYPDWPPINKVDLIKVVEIGNAYAEYVKSIDNGVLDNKFVIDYNYSS